MRRDLLAGTAAGLIGGAVFSWAMSAQGLRASVAGLAGLPQGGAGAIPDLTAAIFIGAGFGLLFRYQALAYAATISSGVLYGLLWWILGPLTLAPLLAGRGPTWTLAQASAALPSLIGHIVFGAITGLAFYVIVAAYVRRYPETVAAPQVLAPTTRIVVLGGGFGGVSAAQRLEQLLARRLATSIVLVSHSNYLLFTPMLAEVASSGLEAQHISAPVRAALPHTRFLRGAVEAIDVGGQTVTVRESASAAAEILPYDHLILALGSVPNFYGLPGLAEHSFTLKTLDDATRLRNHIIALLEAADVEPDESRRRALLTFVVAGGGFAGTEMVAELFGLVHGVLRYYPRVTPGETRFILVHAGARILPEISPALAEYAQRRLAARGIEFLLNTRVAGASADGVRLSGERRLSTRTLVWTAGNQPHPLLGTVPCERTSSGAVIADATLRVGGLERVWAVGDCAQIPDLNADGRPCPPTAQHALRQGQVAAENVAAALVGQAARPFRFRTIGTLVALGHRTAVAEIRGWKFSGFLAWLMWRTVYLSKLPGLEKKVRVALDWTIDLFFPRDIVLTGSGSTPTLAQTIGAQRDEAPAVASAGPEGGS